MARLELFCLKTMWGNFTFDYACSLARGRLGGLISLWDSNLFRKSNIWYDQAYIYGPQDSSTKSSLWFRIRDFMHHHVGKYILFGDLNEVREESERYGSSFSRGEAQVCNSFIDNAWLIDLPMGGRFFTWMNKIVTKMSKLDRFLVSENVLDTFPDIKVTALDQLWSDHKSMLLYIKKLDYGPNSFKFFRSWLQRPDLDVTIKETWAELSHHTVNTRNQFHIKLKELKKKIKAWHSNIKHCECTLQQEVLTLLKSLDERIDSCLASNADREQRIKLLQECDDLEKIAAMDMVQKAHIRWDVEGDENTNFFAWSD